MCLVLAGACFPSTEGLDERRKDPRHPAPKSLEWVAEMRKNTQMRYRAWSCDSLSPGWWGEARGWLEVLEEAAKPPSASGR